MKNTSLCEKRTITTDHQIPTLLQICWHANTDLHNIIILQMGTIGSVHCVVLANIYLTTICVAFKF